MIGQKTLQTKINSLIESNKFPRFGLIVGDMGSGRKTIISQIIGPQLGTVVRVKDNSVESVRKVIEVAYTTTVPMVYVFADIDNMSLSAKNALLKVTEEPPNNACFLMTVTSTDNVLPTILSRAYVFQMDSYTRDEIEQYYKEAYYNEPHSVVKEDLPIVGRYCKTPGDVDLLLSYNPKEFHKYVTLVIDNIAEVSGANSFKIGNKLNLKKDEEQTDKYDLALFWKAFNEMCLLRLYESRKYSEGIEITVKYLTDLRINGLNKQFAFDNWLLDIRRAWMEYATDTED